MWASTKGVRANVDGFRGGGDPKRQTFCGRNKWMTPKDKLPVPAAAVMVIFLFRLPGCVSECCARLLNLGVWMWKSCKLYSYSIADSEDLCYKFFSNISWLEYDCICKHFLVHMLDFMEFDISQRNMEVDWPCSIRQRPPIQLGLLQLQLTLLYCCDRVS